jgi:hypothetical protein
MWLSQCVGHVAENRPIDVAPERNRTIDQHRKWQPLPCGELASGADVWVKKLGFGEVYRPAMDLSSPGVRVAHVGRKFISEPLGKHPKGDQLRDVKTGLFNEFPCRGHSEVFPNVDSALRKLPLPVWANSLEGKDSMLFTDNGNTNTSAKSLGFVVSKTSHTGVHHSGNSQVWLDNTTQCCQAKGMYVNGGVKHPRPRSSA